MAIEFRLPDLGENVTEGEVVRVLVKEGDAIRANQTIMELETEKALLEVPSPASGRVRKIHVAPGKKLKVNEMIVTIEPDAASSSASVPPASTPPVPEKTAAPPPAPTKPVEAQPVVDGSEPSARSEPRPTPPPVTPPANVVELPSANPAPAAPSTRRLARELGVDLSQVKGSGPAGRISQEDVKAFVKGRTSAPPTKSARLVTTGAIPALPDFSRWGEVERQPLSNIRKITMERLTIAWSLIPHVTQVDEVDVTDLEALRERHAERAAAKGGKLTATVFVMKAVVSALKAFPQFNASLDAETEELILKRYYHVGIAVDTDHGLLVPVIRDVDKKHLLDLSAELSMISERARQRKVSLEELHGATFTITNLGGLGGTAFTPIINWPEVAILGLARYQKRLVLKGDRMETRLILPLCLTYDHRIIDGAAAIRFTRKIAAMLEDPALLLLEG